MDVLETLRTQGAMIHALTSDSRQVQPGVAFFAWPGTQVDGRAHIEQALQRGAAAVVWEQEGFVWRKDWNRPNVPVQGLKQMAGVLAAQFHGEPSAALWVCGVTGTNGKTSCSQWIAAALQAHGIKSGVVGTLGAGPVGELVSVQNTTPDPLAIQHLLSQMRDRHVQAVAIEASSHGLQQSRLAGTQIRCALFTNLSHDHLDYHGSMQAYAEAKAQLFSAQGLTHAVINMDDAVGVAFAQRARARGVFVIGTALSANAIAPGSVDASIQVRQLDMHANGTHMVVASTWGDVEVRVRQIGRFNASNLLGVLGCLVAYGLPLHEAVGCLTDLPDVPGRMQCLGGGAAPLVVIDYAHTPDALEKVLLALRPIAQQAAGQLHVVFGAGGDRDATKRPAMGAVAARHADRITLTTDNPRSEVPQAIIEAIRAGVGSHPACMSEVDRAQAITTAIRSAQAHDVVLVAGKGHEAWQEIAGQRIAFSDHEVVTRALHSLQLPSTPRGHA